LKKKNSAARMRRCRSRGAPKAPPSQVASSTDVVEGTAVKDEKQYLLKEEEGRDAGGQPDITGPRGRAGPTPSPSLYRMPPTFPLKWFKPTPQWRDHVFACLIPPESLSAEPPFRFTDPHY